MRVRLPLRRVAACLDLVYKTAMSMSAPTLPPGFKDRRTSLIVFGALGILLGLFAALALLLMLLALALPMAAQMPRQDPRLMVPGFVFYGVLAVTFVWLGTGSIMIRRWARALWLVISWSWLLLGVVAFGWIGFFLSSLFASSPVGQHALPPVARAITVVVMLVICGFVFVLIPGALVLFYRSRHVEATVVAYDPVPCWTDACPLSVLALSLWTGYGAASLLLMPFWSNGVFPFFGVLLSGPAGMALQVGLAVLCVWLSWAYYRMKVEAWWTGLAMVALVFVSSVLTFLRVDMFEMYRLMGYDETMIELMRQQGMTGRGLLLASSLVSLPVLGYLIYVKKHFGSTGAAARA